MPGNPIVPLCEIKSIVSYKVLVLPEKEHKYPGSSTVKPIARLAAMPSIAQKIKGRPGASGFAVIISNDYSSTPRLETLTGTRKDAQNMDAALQSLNVVTHCEHNISKSRLMQLLREAAQCKDYPRDSKCIIFIFSGHGLDSNQVYMQDGSLVKINDVIQQFLPTRAPTIANIPKLFFIDACRGDREMQGVTVPRGVELRDRGGNDATLHVPPEGNFLVAYSTMPYFQAYECKGQGGIWMSILAHKITSSSRSIENILTEVNEELIDLYQSSEWKDTKMQQPEKISRLNKIVYLGGGGGATASSGKKRADGQAKSTTPDKKTATSWSMVSGSPKAKKGATRSPPPHAAKVSPQAKKLNNVLPGSKLRLDQFCKQQGKPSPSYSYEKLSNGCFEATIYVAQTCGRTKGDVQYTKGEAEEDAAAKLLQKLGIY